VVVRERLATFSAETADVGARGCRIALSRPVARGALLQLRFGGDGPDPLDAVGQVVWTRRGARHEAGVAFVSAPKPRATGASWIDAIFAARLHAAARERAGALEELAGLVLRLGAPPRIPLPPVALAIARVAEREGRVSEVVAMPAGVVTLAALVDKGAVTLGHAAADRQGWARLLAAPAPAPSLAHGSAAAAEPGAAARVA
jgi:hypothetical protein